MSKRFFILAVALLCLLALPAAARATDLSGANIDPSVQAAVDATDGSQAVPVLVYGDSQAVQSVVPDGVDTTDLPVIGAVAAYLTPDEIQTLAGDDSVQNIVADNPVYGFDYQSSMDITNLAIGLEPSARTQGRRSRRPRRHGGRAGQRHRYQHRPFVQPHRGLEGLRERQAQAVR